jgi:acetyl-CoA acetyltransferase
LLRFARNDESDKVTEAFICDYVRTPIGRYGGALSPVRADDLAAVPLKALIDRNAGVDWGELDDIILGCANQAGEDNRNLARMAGLLSGLPDSSGGSPSTGCAARASTPLRWRLGRSGAARRTSSLPADPKA